MILTQPALQTKIELKTVPAGLFPQVIRLHRAVFAPSQVACTIYACKGIARYLASLVAFPAYQQEHVLWGAWAGEKLVGYAHFRALPGAWHLNNIAVLPAYRGQGVGSRLWRKFIDTAQQRQFEQLSLDVESDNQAVIEWYRRQGLEITGAAWRYEKRIETGAHPLKTAEHLSLVGWDQAEAWQLAYGFSQFEIHFEGQAWQIGRTGRRYFRVGPGLPAAVENALSQIDPSRRLLVLSPERLTNTGFRKLGKSLRMSGALRERRTS